MALRPERHKSMNRIEFTDVNRFLTSLGLISIGLAFFIPWFVNQNSTLLLIDQERLDKLTPTAKQIIITQQGHLLSVNTILPYISIGLIALGLTLLVIGIRRWSKRQAVSDKIQDEELKSKEIQNLSSQDKRELIATELETYQENDVDEEPELIEQNIDDYINIENQIYLQLSEFYKSSYIPSQNVKIGDYNYDIILKSKDPFKNSDRIIEIKFFKGKLTLENLKDATTQLILASKYYDTSFKRRTVPFLIVLYSDNEFDLALREFKRKLEEYGKTLSKILKVNFIARSQIENTKPSDYLKI